MTQTTRLAFGMLLSALVLCMSAGAPTEVRAEIRPDKIRTADGKKTQAYLTDGLIVGGDQAISEAVVRDVRRAANPGGFERIVVDLQGSQNGEVVAIQRPPFFQVAVNSDEKRVIITVFGHPKLNFDARKVLALFKKSPVVSNVLFYPLLDEDSWSFVLELKEAYPIEAFELTNPVRIILDIKGRKNAALGTASSEAAKPARRNPRNKALDRLTEESAIESESGEE